MSMLGLGLGVDQASLIPSMAQLVKAAGGILYFDTRRATGTGIPTNSPLTNPWVDLMGSGNNAVPQNMAGTTSSGVDTTTSKTTWVLDGIDDHFTLTASTETNITAAPLAIFATVKGNANGGMVICRNDTSSINAQYALYFNPGAGNQNFQCILEGSARYTTPTNSAINATWLNIGYIWKDGIIKAYVNGVQVGVDTAYSSTLTTRTYLRIGRRETSASHFKGSLATVTLYAGSKITEAGILKAENTISKQYI